MSTDAVHLDAQLTYEDYREFVTFTSGQQSAKPWKSAFYSLITPAVVLWYALPQITPIRSWPGATPAEQNLWVALVPMLMVVTQLIGPSLLKAVAASGGKGTTIAAAASYLPLVWLLTLTQPALAIPWHPMPGQVVAMTLVPWVTYLSYLTFLKVPPLAEKRLQKRWAAVPTLHRPFRAEINHDVTWFDDGIRFCSYRWAQFKRYSETPGLLLLTDVNGKSHMLPKSCMDDPTLTRVRSLIQSHVATGKFLTRPTGFEVLPSPAPAA
jgi:hypothetical protein